MKTFGIKDYFSIEYICYIDAFSDDPEFLKCKDDFEMFGCVYFWLKNKNIFEYKKPAPQDTYSWDLNILIDFFTSQSLYHLTNDPFPVKTNALIAIDAINENSLIKGPDNDIRKYLEVDWKKVDMDEQREIDRWSDNHGLLTHRAGSFLPDAFFRRAGKNVEISWQNDFPHESESDKFYFTYERGVEYIDAKIYRDVIIDFCNDFINKFMFKYPERMLDYKRKLKVIMDLPLDID